MSSSGGARSGWGITIVVAVLAAVGISAAAFVLTKPDVKDAPHGDRDAAVVDAGADARARGPAKPKPGTKKRVGRGSKTPVASGGVHHGGGGHAGAGGGAHHVGAGGPSYEAALSSHNEQIAIGEKAGPDLTDAQLSAPMSDGSFVNECGAPDNMTVTVKVAIKMGHAVGVSVYTEPHAADVASCIDHHVRKLSWPTNPKLDSFVTTY